MSRPHTPSDLIFLRSLAEKLLDRSDVATGTSSTLERHGIDADRVTALLRETSTRGVAIPGFEFKLIGADPREPQSFGVLVRRKAARAAG